MGADRGGAVEGGEELESSPRPEKERDAGILTNGRVQCAHTCYNVLISEGAGHILFLYLHL